MSIVLYSLSLSARRGISASYQVHDVSIQYSSYHILRNVGTEASKQFSALDDVTTICKIYFACRSREKIEGSIDNLDKGDGLLDK